MNEHIYKTGAGQQNMRVQTKALRYWKTEHKDLDNCQDFYALEASQGLFAVADGAGTTLFPAIWARIIANHFVHIPLMSKNPFEIEWWVRLAQEEYKASIPNLSQIQDPFVRQKAQNQGSDSTLATLRISASLPAEAQAELLVFGDSCVIIGNTLTQEVKSFVLQDPDQFAQAPICIPSTLKFFNRSFHTCSLITEMLRPEHRVIIASDAVSKWILSAGNNRYRGPAPTWTAFQAIYDTTEQGWPAFIEECRDKHEMVNDDATALILTFFDDTAQEGEPITPTTSHDDATLKIRKEAFDKAYQEPNSELLAIYYGDGADIRPLVPTLTDKEIKHARDVADALKELLRHFRQYQNTPGLAARMQPFWQQYGPILQDEKCAENIRTTLQNNGVNLSFTPIAPTLSATPASPATPGSQFKQISPSYLTNPAPVPTPKPIIPPTIPASNPPISNQPIQPSLEPAKDTIELEFLRAYNSFRDMPEEEKKTKFELFLNAFDTLETAFRYHKQVYPLNSIQEYHIQQARNYKQTLESLQRALRTGYAENIIANYNPSLISNQRLTPDELEAVQLSRQFLAADQDEDDNALLTTFDKMKRFGITPSLPSSLQFTPEDNIHIERARQRLDALKTFKAVLETKRLTQIAASYNPILENSKALSKDDRELLQLAQEFSAALSQNDDAIVAAYKHILLSPQHSSIAFDEKERKLIANAQQTVNERYDFYASTAAKFKTKDISVERLYKACLFYYEMLSAHNKYLDYILSNNPTEEAKMSSIRGKQDLQEKMLAKNITTETLKSLINDLFIVEKMRDEKIQKEFHDIYRAQNQMENELVYFKNVASPTYEIFINAHSISEQEIQIFISIPLRYSFYKAYFADQQSILNPRKTTLDDWLEKQRKEVSYLHNTLEQTAQGISESPYWRI